MTSGRWDDEMVVEVASPSLGEDGDTFDGTDAPDGEGAVTALAVHPRSVRGAQSVRPERMYQIHSVLRSFIRSGVIKEGETINENDFVTSFGASRSAVRAALQLLTEEGLVVRKRRAGTTVVRSLMKVPQNEIVVGADGFADPRYVGTQISTQTIPGNVYLASRLELPLGPVRITEWLIRFEGVPACVCTSFLAEGPPASRLRGDVAPLEQTFKFMFETPIGGVRCTVEAIGTDLRMSTLLQIPKGSPALLRELVLLDSDGQPREITHTLYRGDMFAINIDSSLTVAARNPD